MEINTGDIIELIKQQNELNKELLETSKLEIAAAHKLAQEQKESKEVYEQLKEKEEERIELERKKIKEIENSHITQQKLIIVVESLLQKIDISTNFIKETIEDIIEVLSGVKTINFIIATELLKFLVKNDDAIEQIKALRHALITIGESKSSTVDLGIHSKGNTYTGDNIIGKKEFKSD